MSERPAARHLGLIGGLGPDATVHYYRELLARHEKAGRLPRLTIAHADVETARQRAAANDREGLARYLNGFVEEVARSGAELTAIVAVTPHLCAPQLTRIAPLPLIDMVSEVAKALRQRGLRRVALLGTRFTIETRLFGGLAGVDVVMPTAERIARIDTLYYDFVGGRGSDAKFFELQDIAAGYVRDDHAEAVLVAGTDLSPHLARFDSSLPLIDCAQLHLDAIAARLFE